MRRRLIVGLDPGTTAGYAILDLQGKLIEIGASKSLTLNELLKIITEKGKVIAVGTDKRKCPALIEKFAARTGAKIFIPGEDMSINDKSNLVKIKCNDHERDALAGAIYCSRQLASLISRIKIYTERNNLSEKFEELSELVIREEMSIKRAVETLQESPAKDLPVVVKIRPPKFENLFDKNKKLKHEIAALHFKISKFKALAEGRRGVNKYLKNKLKKVITGTKHEQDLNNRNAAIGFLRTKVYDLSLKYRELEKEKKTLEEFLSKVADYVILRKTSNLNKGLSMIQEKDILLVENVNEYSEKAVGLLEGKVSIIISKVKPLTSTKNNLKFTVLFADQLTLQETTNFATIKKEELNKLLDKETILEKVLQTYKNR